MSQVKAWLLTGDVQKLVVVVAGIDSGETLERWQFNVNVDQTGSNQSFGNDENNPHNVVKAAPSKKKSIKEIHNEIQAIIRQITASVSVEQELARWTIANSHHCKNLGDLPPTP